MKIKILNLNWRNRNEKTKWEDRLMEKINYAVMINFSASSKRRIVEIISQEIQKAVEARDKEWIKRAKEIDAIMNDDDDTGSAEIGELLAYMEKQK